MKARRGTGIFGKFIAGLLFGATRTARCKKHSHHSTTCKAKCGLSIGEGSPFILQRHPWRGWIGGRRERRHHTDTDPDRNRTRRADEEERALIQAELTPDTREASTQAALLPAWRSFPSQTPPPEFSMSQNPDRSVTLEHTSIHIRILGQLTRRE